MPCYFRKGNVGETDHSEEDKYECDKNFLLPTVTYSYDSLHSLCEKFSLEKRKKLRKLIHGIHVILNVD